MNMAMAVENDESNLPPKPAQAICMVCGSNRDLPLDRKNRN